VDDKLGEYDKKNIEHILAFENSVPNLTIKKEDLYGEWSGRYPLASGPYNDISFKKDGTVRIGYNSMLPKAATSCSGTYEIKNGYIVISISEQDIDIGEYFHSGFMSVGGGMESDLYSYSGKLKFRNNIVFNFPVSNLKEKYLDTEIIENAQIRQIGSFDRVKLNDSGGGRWR
ncbi:MAG: hypothetical protein LBN21_01960, partial [Treponema sp.]|nr:hypothetical protein [Treponema sp.]